MVIVKVKTRSGRIITHHYNENSQGIKWWKSQVGKQVWATNPLDYRRYGSSKAKVIQVGSSKRTKKRRSSSPFGFSGGFRMPRLRF